MRTATLSIVALQILLSPLASTLTLDCTHIRVDNKKFNFEKLKGPHWVTVLDEDRPPSIHNTTYTVDICAPLKRDPDIPKADQCPQGTNVCAIERTWNPVDNTVVNVESVIPIAGNYETTTGRGLQPKYARLKASDTQTEGLRMELHGGQYNKRDQIAVIEFQCDLERTGNEGFEDAQDKVKRALKRAAEDGDKKEEGKPPADDDTPTEEDNKSLQFVSYGATDDKTDLLRLNWKTKYACEDFEDDEDDSSSGKGTHWGFFTWFIIILFLGVAAYLIFASWLNYNRYGARGWDLLPHGDTIRDIPYLFKDWSRKVVDTVQGSGTRGGYSAV